MPIRRVAGPMAKIVSMVSRLASAASLAVAATAVPAAAQYAASCPPPQKLAAGACVTVCPAGYEDRGRECMFRSLSR